MSHILVRPHNQHAAGPAVNAAQIEYIGIIIEIGTKCLFTVNQPKATFWRAQQYRQITQIQRPEIVLYDAPHINDGIDILARSAIDVQRRGSIGIKVTTQLRQSAVK